MRLFKGRSSAQSDFLERTTEVHVLAGRCQLQTSLNELVVADAGSARCFWKARVVSGIRKNSRKRIHFDNLRLACSIESHIDARPVATAKNPVRVEGNSLDRARQSAVDACWAVEHVERLLGTIPDSFGLEAIDRNRAFGQRRKIDS